MACLRSQVRGNFTDHTGKQEGGIGRCVAYKQRQATDTPHFVAIDWGSHSWLDSTDLEVTPPSPNTASSDQALRLFVALIVYDII